MTGFLIFLECLSFLIFLYVVYNCIKFRNPYRLFLVFGPKGHGLNTLEVGLCFLGIAGGITFGPLVNIIQEKYYQRRVRQANGANIPESRVRMGKIAAITHPISLFWFAWTTYKSINPVVPVLATALWGWSFYVLILMSYQYTEDSYKDFAASALA